MLQPGHSQRRLSENVKVPGVLDLTEISLITLHVFVIYIQFI